MKPKGKATPMDITIGQMLRKHRLAAGLSQEMLGMNLGITFQQVQKYESGTNRVSAARLYEIAPLLGCSLLDFFPEPTRVERQTRARDQILSELEDVRDGTIKALKLMQRV